MRVGAWFTGSRLRVASVLAVVAASCLSASGDWAAAGNAHGRARAPAAFVRVNQVGYPSGGTKVAVLMASASEDGTTFRVVNGAGHTVLSGPVGADRGAWSPSFPHTYRLAFSGVSAAGRYRIRVTGPVAAASPWFRVGSSEALYEPLVANARRFLLAQRDSADVDGSVLDRKPSHLADRQASIYAMPQFHGSTIEGDLHRIGGPVDVAGGWLDAGDYLKFVETASFTDALMFLAAARHPALAGIRAEAVFGLRWLRKAWVASSRTLYFQVGIGEGNAKIAGDHDLWRLPQADDRLQVQPGDRDYFVKHRPVFRAGPPGSRVSPNLAGRLAAVFALCFRVERTAAPDLAASCLRRAEVAFGLAKTTDVGRLLTTAPHGFYPESEWRDDMELGAVELALALHAGAGHLPAGLPHADPGFYLQRAAHWAEAYMLSPLNGSDSLNLYDVAGLAHPEVAEAMRRIPHGALPIGEADLENDLRDQLDPAAGRADGDPFGLGYPLTAGDVVPHALGLALEARGFDRMAGSSRYAGFAAGQLDFALGRNAWGTSFVIGAGSTFPHCPQHQVANLAGSLDGRPPVLLGATVDGPQPSSLFQDLGVPDGARACPPGGGNALGAFDGQGARYLDDVRSWPSVEPADDYTVLGLLLFTDLAG